MQIDPCLFILKMVIVVAYVDDCLIFSKEKPEIDKLIKSFKEDRDEFNWEMKIKNTVHEFLGIKVTELPGGEFKFTQKGLIEKVLKTTNCIKVNPKLLEKVEISDCIFVYT